MCCVSRHWCRSWCLSLRHVCRRRWLHGRSHNRTHTHGHSGWHHASRHHRVRKARWYHPWRHHARGHHPWRHHHAWTHALRHHALGHHSRVHHSWWHHSWWNHAWSNTLRPVRWLLARHSSESLPEHRSTDECHVGGVGNTETSPFPSFHESIAGNTLLSPAHPECCEGLLCITYVPYVRVLASQPTLLYGTSTYSTSYWYVCDTY